MCSVSSKPSSRRRAAIFAAVFSSWLASLAWAPPELRANSTALLARGGRLYAAASGCPCGSAATKATTGSISPGSRACYGLLAEAGGTLSLWTELQRRRVFRALVGYGIAAFAVLQIIEPIMHGLHWPDAVLSYVVVALAIGFPIVVGLAWIFDVNAGRIERTAPAAGLRGARLAAVLVGVGVLAASPGLYYYLVVRGGRAAPVPSGGPSIAVLPLTNLSSDKEQEYFSDGLADELLNLLAKVPGLRVAARTSAFAFKGKNADVVEIAQKLHVATVLEGSVRRSGDQIRITTQLINATDGYHLWSETYNRKLTDVFAVQDEIATAVVSALKLKLLQAPTSKDRRTVNAEAYNQYLLGRQFFFRSNWEDYRRAMQAYRKAVELDPTYAPAWAGLANATFWVA